MIVTHNFETPRNLFEKLLRDAGKLENEVNGDNTFNFIATTHYLRDWIKKSPMSDSEVTKRFLRRIVKDENFKICASILNHAIPFCICLDEVNNHKYMQMGNEKIDIIKFRDELVELYSVYFKLK